MNETFFKGILDQIPDGVYFVDKDRTITYWNKGAERITGYMSHEVVGSSCENQILKHVDSNGTDLCLGHCPAKEALAKGIPQEAEAYLHHKNGHRVLVSIHTAPLHDSKRRLIGAVEVFSDDSTRGVFLERIQELEKLSLVDPLTGLTNRRAAEINLHSRLEEMRRYGWPFGILFMDIDHFKSVNDQFGHDSGDRVLRMVAATLNNCIRSFDMVARWGGEEFMAILSNTDSKQLLLVANRIRALVEKSSFSSDSHVIQVTVSIGGTLGRPYDDEDSVVRRADRLMYQCKNLGRNQVSID